ncbi:TPA: GHMP kinase [archaeon]|uniref:GHMP kinase n=1 Tax=Candidatus Naiadarchaeum limnaeum TaxID=2756139 RepID=A0A832UVZ9_9ARCH|nr:GHMP kinase [Candidatus Naiadarchaeum limnaeum]
MIISRTPLRVSFAGGGTDLKEYYSRQVGAVISTAIDKYVYITVNNKFDSDIRVKYSKTENVDSAEQLEHPLFRETMKFTGVTKGVEITSVADVPTRGSGLGSSSTFTVGLLNALYAYKGQHTTAEKLASEACKIEIDILKEPIGKQDQYIAAYGGFDYIQFMPDGIVKVDPIIIKKDVKEEIESNMSLFFTGIERKSSEILNVQKKVTGEKEKVEILTKMRDIAAEMRNALHDGEAQKVGELLHKGWELKKKVVGGISNQIIDEMYAKARKAGASGGKVCGAGGGGFVLIYAPEEKMERVRQALKGHKELPFKFSQEGSKIVYIGS